MKTFLCSHLVTLRVHGREFYGNLEKIGASSATVNAEEGLQPGDAVSVATGSYVMAGRVSACEADPFGYLIDIALDLPWSRDRFEPEHFTDPDLIAIARRD